MKLIFCDSGFSHKEVDYMYADEYATAKQNGTSTSLISFEELKKSNINNAINGQGCMKKLNPPSRLSLTVANFAR